MTAVPIENAVIVIMAGGAGTRFWPLSNRTTPKQLLRLHGDRTLLQMSFDRAAKLVGPDRVYIVSGEALRDAIQQNLPQLPSENYIAEPAALNTAACLGLAATHLDAAHGGGALMGVLTADHLIEEGPVFERAVRAALDHASRTDDLVTIGMQPTHGDPGFGYLELGEQIAAVRINEHEEPVYRVRRFIEKPHAEIAQKYVEAGNYRWNSGMFFWRISALLGAFREHQPFMAQQLARLRASGKPPFGAARLKEVFNEMPALPIDVAIMEKSSNVAAVTGNFGWQDVGSWDSLSRVRGADERQNCVIGPAIVLDSNNNIIYNDSAGGHGGTPPEIVLNGVDDLLIVLTDKALLITPKSKVQDVKGVVQQLDRMNRSDLT